MLGATKEAEVEAAEREHPANVDGSDDDVAAVPTPTPYFYPDPYPLPLPPTLLLTPTLPPPLTRCVTRASSASAAARRVPQSGATHALSSAGMRAAPCAAVERGECFRSAWLGVG